MPRPAPTSPTRLQQKIYDYIVAFKREYDGESPTIREMADFVGISSTSVVNYHLGKLARFGMLEFQKPSGRSRMIIIIGGTWNPPTPAGK